MFGIGIAELLIFLVVATLFLGVPIGLVVLLVILLRRRTTDDADVRMAQLLDENQRMRDELAARDLGKTPR